VTNKQKLLFISNSSPERISHILDAFNSRSDLVVETEHLWLGKRKDSVVHKFFEKIKLPLDSDNINERLYEKVRTFNPDIIFIVKGNYILPGKLKLIRARFPRIKIVSWSLDDMYAWHNRSAFYTFGLKHYDVVFTSKSYNINELKRVGAKRVAFLYQAYSTIYHAPPPKCETNFDVLFIGFAEEERFEYLQYLAEHGIKVTIYGTGWNKKSFFANNNNIEINAHDLIGDDYAKAICSSRITLCFLRKINRDLHTSRSVEIPACGGGMLAERTSEHLELFEEDVEAAYFSSKEELLDKTNYYLANSDKLSKLKSAGLKRTKESNYSYDNMVDRILDELKNL